MYFQPVDNQVLSKRGQPDVFNLHRLTLRRRAQARQRGERGTAHRWVVVLEAAHHRARVGRRRLAHRHEHTARGAPVYRAVPVAPRGASSSAAGRPASLAPAARAVPKHSRGRRTTAHRRTAAHCRIHRAVSGVISVYTRGS